MPSKKNMNLRIMDLRLEKYYLANFNMNCLKLKKKMESEK